MGWLDGEVALVTGGGSGIGRAVVDRYVEEGARVVVADLDADRLAEVRRVWGEAVTTIVTDVRDIHQNKAAVAHAVARFGRLDVFVANAGLNDRFADLADIPEHAIADAYAQIFDVNVKGVILGAKAALPELVRTRGAFVVTLSNSSFWPDGGGVLYVASKHAALGVVRQLAHEFAPFVRVNAVAPGATKTNIAAPAALDPLADDDHADAAEQSAHGDPQGSDPQGGDTASGESEVERITPLRRLADPADHAAAYVLLASRTQSSVMTGTVIESDAGLGIRGLRRVRGGDDLYARVHPDER